MGLPQHVMGSECRGSKVAQRASSKQYDLIIWSVASHHDQKQ